MTSDGKKIISGSDDKTIRIWETETGKECNTFFGHEVAVQFYYLSHSYHLD